MNKYQVTVWYSLPKWATFEIEASSEMEAHTIAQQKLCNEDTSTWNEASDADITIDVYPCLNGRNA